MKRYGQLWSQITALDNLLQASHQAQRGKRSRPNVIAFNDRLDLELLQLQQELQSQNYQLGAYHSFITPLTSVYGFPHPPSPHRDRSALP